MQRIALEKNSQTVKMLPEVPVFTVLSKHKAPRGAVLEGPYISLGKGTVDLDQFIYFFLSL